MKIHVLHIVVDAQCTANNVSSKTYRILTQATQLIPKSNHPLFFEMSNIFTRAKLFRRVKKYGKSEDYKKFFYQKSPLLFLQHVFICLKRRDAEYLTHQFQDKFITNTVPERIFKRIEDLYWCSLHHAANFQEILRKSEATAKYANDCYRSG